MNAVIHVWTLPYSPLRALYAVRRRVCAGCVPTTCQLDNRGPSLTKKMNIYESFPVLVRKLFCKQGKTYRWWNPEIWREGGTKEGFKMLIGTKTAILSSVDLSSLENRRPRLPEQSRNHENSEEYGTKIFIILSLLYL